MRIGLWGLAGLVAGTAGAAAQTIQLPQITVNAPSPIQRTISAPSLPGEWIIVPDVFAPLTVVTGEEINRSTGRTLGDLLAIRPGITGSSFAPGAASRPVIRGLDNYRVRVQENGIGTHDVSEIGEDHAVPIDPLAVQKIEVIRGPATLRYGSQAIGGVVSAENNRIPTAVPPRGFAAETRGAVSSVDNGGEGAVLLDAGKGNFAFHADAFGRRASDYRIPSYPYLFPGDEPPVVGNRQPNSSMRADGQALGGSYVFHGGYAGVSVSRFATFYHVPGLESAETNSRIDLRQFKVQSKGEFRPQSGAVETIRYWAGGSDYKHDEFANENGFDGVQQTFTNKELEGRVEAQLTPFDLRWATLQTAVGAQTGHQRLTSTGLVDGGLFDPNRTSFLAGFIFNELQFTQTTRAQLAGRIEHVAVRGAFPDLIVDDSLFLGRSPSFTPVSASVGLLQDLPLGLVASVTAQHVERAPRAPELFSLGIHHATETFDIGNPNLGIEKAQTVEIGLRRAKGAFRFDATAYHTRYKGFIYRRLTGLTCTGGFASCEAPHEEVHHEEEEHEEAEEHGHAHGLNQAIYTQRDAKFTGAEVFAQLDLVPVGGGMFGIDGQYDIVRARFDDGTNVPRIPPQRVGGGVWWRNDSWFARVGLLHAFAQNDVADFETPTAGYNLLKAELTYRQFIRTPAGPTEVTLGLVGDNLLDDDVRNSVSFRKDEVLLPGRTVRAFATVKF
jgi:iron complex outermembrane receptor protein